MKMQGIESILNPLTKFLENHYLGNNSKKTNVSAGELPKEGEKTDNHNIHKIAEDMDLKLPKMKKEGDWHTKKGNMLMSKGDIILAKEEYTNASYLYHMGGYNDLSKQTKELINQL